MKLLPTAIADVVEVEPQVFGDERGFFYESFNQRDFWASLETLRDHHSEAFSPPLPFVQDNHSRSGRHVLRGLHYQLGQPQGKLTRVVVGQIFDVAVDLRRRSPSFGQWVGRVLSADNQRQLWIPPGFAHGFLVLSEVADVLYKTTDYYAPQQERCILWNDSDLKIDWPLAGVAPILSAKDQAGIPFSKAEVFA